MIGVIGRRRCVRGEGGGFVYYGASYVDWMG